ncbi:MAG: hypothetical protein NDJ90_04915 [Oligoflexia bacterium]|nr:hypothetical protein [Oligoflexia bacterium]
MSQLVLRARAPSNIALIKYMGKKDSSRNLPENGSISLTLDALCSLAEVSVAAGRGTVEWRPELPAPPAGVGALSFQVPHLSEEGKAKVLRQVERVRSAAHELLPRWGVPLRPGLVDAASSERWVFRTANSFPQASGIASSASSFAAVTLATAGACAAERESFQRAWRAEPPFRAALARVSREGSGSSCRSLDGPWVQWEGEDVSVLPSRLPRLAHFVLLVSSQAKKVSSSEAHQRVKGSPLWQGRVERVERRLAQLRQAIGEGELAEVARVAWSEAWEMHSLFHTAAEPFSYWEPGTMLALQALAPWVRETEPPIVTLDAGPNIHVIVEATRTPLWEPRLRALGFELLRDGQGTGGGLL